jgi:CheY-like chemotaxis protein
MSKRILVVEDHEDNRQILRDLLGSAGYEMIEAGNGEAGVAAAAAEHPDLILMDIQLPILDGYEATRQIKADPELERHPHHRRDLLCPRAATRRRPALPAAMPMSPSPTVRASCWPASGTSWTRIPAIAMHSPPRILIVDDNEANRDILDARLQVHGYELLQAADGEEALDAARQHLPDLILLDVMMPKLDGIEVCRQLKGDATLPLHAHHPGDRQGGLQGRGGRAGGRRRRISDQAGRSDRAGGARQVGPAAEGAARRGAVPRLPN